MQMLFQWEMSPQEPAKLEAKFWKAAKAADTTRAFANGLFEGAAKEAPALDEVTATELKQRMDSGREMQVIDVREPFEYEIAKIPGTKLIPLNQVVARMNEIDPSRDTVVHCKGGVRSAKAIASLKQAGFPGRLINLKGGITAWSDEVDQAVPKY